MKDLISLVKIVNKQKVRRINIISESSSSTTKIQTLYNGIASGIIKNDEDALTMLYQHQTDRLPLAKLKSRLKKRLVNSIFFIDVNQPSFSDYKRAKFELHRLWTAVRLLIDRGDRIVSLELLENIISVSLKFDFTDISVLSARELTRHYSIINPSNQKAKYYQGLLDAKIELLNKELILESYYNQFSLLSITDKSPDKTKLVSLIENAEEEIKYIFLNFKSLLVTVYYFYILSEKYLIRKEYERCINLCKTSLKFFTNRKAKNKVIEAQINNTLILSHLSLGNLKVSLTLIDKNLKVFPLGSYTWFKVLSYKCSANFLLEHYTEAMDDVQLAVSNPQINSYGFYFELYQLQEAYLNLLLKINRINPKHGIRYRKFKIAKFLNNMPKFSKDKRGLNVAILIVGLIHFLEQKKYDKTLKRLDSLKQYSFRYLRNDFTFRSNCFIKMLCKIPDANYHSEAVLRHTKKLYQKLAKTKYSFSDNPAEIEVIPYENLWEIVLEILKNKQNKRHA